MNTQSTYRQLVEQILTNHASIPYANSSAKQQTIFDRDGNHYLIMLVGRDGTKRVHGCLIHVDIVGNKIWIQRDGTEQGVAVQLLEAGVPKEHIVLAFRSPEMRQHTGFAVS